MIGYERSYLTGRTISSVLEILGWVVVSLGVLSAIEGFATGGSLGFAQRGFGGGRPEFIFRILGMVPGILLTWAGLISIMGCQFTRAALDSAEMQREMLRIARGDSGSTAPQVIASSEIKQKADSASVSLIEDQIIEIEDRSGKKRKVYKTEDGLFATLTLAGDIKTFSSLDDAKAYLA